MMVVFVGAACYGADPDIFFPTQGRTSGAAAKEICAVCPAIDECRQFATDLMMDRGIWGGTSERERRRIRARRAA